MRTKFIVLLFIVSCIFLILSFISLLKTATAPQAKTEQDRIKRIEKNTATISKQIVDLEIPELEIPKIDSCLSVERKLDKIIKDFKLNGDPIRG